MEKDCWGLKTDKSMKIDKAVKYWGVLNQTARKFAHEKMAWCLQHSVMKMLFVKAAHTPLHGTECTFP